MASRVGRNERLRRRMRSGKSFRLGTVVESPVVSAVAVYLERGG